MNEKKLFLLDAYALIFRAYYALIRAPRFTSNGFNTSAIFGFVNTLQEILKKENPTHIAVCFDPPGPTFRHVAYEKYKAEREATPEDIKKSIPYIKDIIRAYNIPIIEVAGFEADDVIGTMAHLAEPKGYVTYMMTPDKDFGQLVTENVKIFKPAYKGGDFEIRGVDEICARYQLQNPLQVIDLLALMGDKVDNIPGCPGVGEVTAIKLIKEFGSVENLLENTDKLKGALKTKVEANVENIRFSKFLATIKTDVPVEFDENALIREQMNSEALREIFEKLEFRTLIARLLEPKKVEVAQPVKINQQASLFDFDAPAEDVKPVAEQPKVLTKDYKLMLDKAEIEKAVKTILAGEKFGFALICDGDSAMTANLIGFALAGAVGKACYIPYSADSLESLRPIFENNKIAAVGNNVKFDMIVLRRNGVKLTAPYFDTAVAHYLIQPEQGHGYNLLADTLLNVATIAEDTILEGKGKSKAIFASLSYEALKDFACEQADIALQLKPILCSKIAENGMESLLNDVEIPLIEVLADMEYTGVRIEVNTLNDYSKTLTANMQAIEAECYELAGEEFNTGSPMKVGEVLFEKLKIDDKAKRTKSGQYSTTEDVLTKLLDRHPIVERILSLRGVRKLLSTYVNALPELINSTTGRIHTTYNQTVTATGRLSSTNPNMQNIPVRNDEGREIRKAFIPAEGNVFFSADYSQIELRLVADLSNDEAMVASFLADEDIHRATAAKIYHEKLEEVTDTQRRNAKTANFGILYGISAFGLSERLRIPRSEAKMLIDGYLSTYPQVHRYMEQSIEIAKQQGYVLTQFGRRRMLPEINSRNAVVRSFSERNAINAPIQGTAADIIKIAMVRIYRRFADEGIKSKMTMQVHDELNFDVLPSELERVSEIVTTEMRGAYSGKVPLTASHSAGANWLEAH
ncbi:MAG: DNA polymerase I [Muribaculaceae bacterium]|nr:DNA polymerase I [Muribaculaceae bacterium]